LENLLVNLVLRTHYRIILSGVVLFLLTVALWSMPLQAHEESAFQQATQRLTPTPTSESIPLLLTVDTSSCVLSVYEPPPPEATPRATYRPTITPIPATPTEEATIDPDAFVLDNAPIYTIGEGCDEVAEYLSVPINDMLWFSLMIDGDDVSFLRLQVIPDDPFQPQLDARGRYFACGIPEEGQQVCQVAVMVSDQAYIVQIPVNVEEAYFVPVLNPEATDAP
jgi:hypothetical protein